MAPNNHRLETGVGPQPTSLKPQASSDKQQASGASFKHKFQAASLKLQVFK